MTDADTPEDEDIPDDEAEAAEGESPDEGDERLAALGETIDDARQTAEDADVLVDPDERRFSEGGDDNRG